MRIRCYNEKFSNLVKDYYNGKLSDPKPFRYGYAGRDDLGIRTLNTWSDPQIIYKGIVFNLVDFEQPLWDEFQEVQPNGTYRDFDYWMRENREIVRDQIDDMYFEFDNNIETEKGTEKYCDAIKRIPKKFVRQAMPNSKQNIYVIARVLYAESR